MCYVNLSFLVKRFKQFVALVVRVRLVVERSPRWETSERQYYSCTRTKLANVGKAGAEKGDCLAFQSSD